MSKQAACTHCNWIGTFAELTSQESDKGIALTCPQCSFHVYNFEKFRLRRHVTGKAARATTSRGMIRLNRVALDLAGNPEYVVLGYDKERRVVGIRASNEGEQHRYKATKQKRGGGCFVAARAFIAHYGLALDDLQFYPEIHEGWLCLSLDDAATLPERRGGRQKKEAA